MEQYIKKSELNRWLNEKREHAEANSDYTREMTYREVIKKIEEE